MDMISSISLEESTISLTINWVPVYPNSPCAQVYKVYHTHDISGVTISDLVPRNVTTKTLTRLRANDWYTVRVMAVFNDDSVSRNVSSRGRTLTSARHVYTERSIATSRVFSSKQQQQHGPRGQQIPQQHSDHLYNLYYFENDIPW
uniref:Fibronectin type-III domain-containing protein n=1 Tax=Timema poppense TaxID=170557 RepID=A0A7R9HJZ4_TIMPO|nr:unnamed protein product [Timema poppensis]